MAFEFMYMSDEVSISDPRRTTHPPTPIRQSQQRLVDNGMEKDE